MSIIKTYAYKGITVDAAQITNRRMSDVDRADLNAWLDKHNVNVTIDTEFTYGIESSVAISVETPDYSFYMNPGDWLAHDGDIFFHITDKVFREHYREVPSGEDDAVVYATGIDMYQFIPPAWRTHKPDNGLTNIDKYPPIDGLLNLDDLPPAHLAPGECHDRPRPRKRRGGATMGAAYLDGVEIVTGGKAVRHPFVDAIRKAQAKAKAAEIRQQAKELHDKAMDACAEAFKHALDADEHCQQAKETNQETYDRHLKLLDNDGHADQCDYCKDTSRNMIPPAHNKALADAVDKQLADMTRRRGAAHLHMDRDGKVTPARRLREELERQWHHTHTAKTTPRTRAAEWKVPLEILAMYYNQFPPTVKDEGMGEKGPEAVAQSVFDAYHGNLRSCLDVIRQLTDGDSTIQSLIRQANNNLDGMHRTTPAPTTGPEANND